MARRALCGALATMPGYGTSAPRSRARRSRRARLRRDRARGGSRARARREPLRTRLVRATPAIPLVTDAPEVRIAWFEDWPVAAFGVTGGVRTQVDEPDVSAPGLGYDPGS